MSVNEFRLDPRSGDVTVERSNGEVDSFSLANAATVVGGQVVGPNGQPVGASSGMVDISKLAGVDPSGNNDSTAAVASALDQYGSIFIPLDARIKIDKLEMPPGSTISGPGKIVYVDTNNPDDKTIRMYSDCQIVGPTFVGPSDRSVPRYVVYSENGAENLAVMDCKFKGGVYAGQSFVGYERWVHMDQGAKSPKVVRNKFDWGAYPIFGVRTQDGIYDLNEINGSVSGLTFYGGKYNKVRGNRINGRNVHYSADTGSNPQSTITGILFLTYGFLTDQRGIIGNEICGNFVTGVAEEGIGLDVNGDSVGDSAENQVVPIATVQSVSNLGNGRRGVVIQEPTLVGGAVAPSNWANECYACVLTGAAVGTVMKVIASTSSSSANTATIVLARSPGDIPLAQGDKILLSYGILYNKINDNTILNTTTCISLFGSSWHNDVQDNTMRGISTGIQCGSVVAGLTVGANAQGINLGGVQSYAGPTKIAGNTISLDYETQPLADSRGVNQETGPIVVGTWAYGTPAVSNQNTGMQIKDNILIASRDSKLGGSFATADAGFSTMTGGVVSGNQYFGGGGLSIRRTLALNLGVNYAQYSREDYKAASSADNTNLKVLP